MTSKERVKRTIHFENPDRPPVRFAFDAENSDMAGVGFKNSKSWTPKNPDEDEFGCVWDNLNGAVITSYSQVKEFPIKKWEDYGNYRFPDPHDKTRYEDIEKNIESRRDKYIFAGVGISGFNRLTFLRGYENFLTDLYFEREKASRLAEKYFVWEMETIKELSNFRIDGIWLADDWGTQRALMVSPALWREFFKPLYKKQFDFIHGLGFDIIFHTCGYVNEIIPELIEIGVDALNLNQPRTLGIENLAKYRGGVCFLCPVDMQTTIIEGREDEIVKEANHIFNSLWNGDGGFIPCADEGIDHRYIPQRNIEIMKKAFLDIINEKSN